MRSRAEEMRQGKKEEPRQRGRRKEEGRQGGAREGRPFERS